MRHPQAQWLKEDMGLVPVKNPSLRLLRILLIPCAALLFVWGGPIALTAGALGWVAARLLLR